MCCVCAGSPGDNSSASTSEFLQTSLPPLLAACEESAKAMSDTIGIQGQADGQHSSAELFLLNCLLAIWSPLSVHTSCAGQAAALRERIDMQVLSMMSATPASACGCVVRSKHGSRGCRLKI
jgi:hypothetical protein